MKLNFDITKIYLTDTSNHLYLVSLTERKYRSEIQLVMDEQQVRELGNIKDEGGILTLRST